MNLDSTNTSVILNKSLPLWEPQFLGVFFLFVFVFYDSHREREAETQAEGEAGSMHWEPDVGFDPGSPGSRPGPKAGAKPLRHPGIPRIVFLKTMFFRIL